MNCFQHRDTPAIGVCKSCGRAVCPTCARVQERALTCSDVCEKDAEAMLAMNARALKIYGVGAERVRGLPTAVAAPLIGGCGFLAMAAYAATDANFGPVPWLFAFMGVVFLFGAFMAWRKYRQHGLNV